VSASVFLIKYYLIVLYITATIGQLVLKKLKALAIVFDTFPKTFFPKLHALFVTKTIEFGFQPPIELQDATFISSYKKNNTLSNTFSVMK